MSSQRIGYIRVSALDQSTERQLDGIAHLYWLGILLLGGFGLQRVFLPFLARGQTVGLSIQNSVSCVVL